MSKTTMFRALASGCALAAMVMAAPAFAEDSDKDSGAIALSGEVAFDLAGVVAGGYQHRIHALDTIFVTADIDLEKLAGWNGASAALTFLSTGDGSPNNDVGALQGINNNEVGERHQRLFEAWIEQAFGDKASLRVGQQDLNSEFYVTDSAGVLLAPQYGLASELAATGPGGPSTYPQTGLAVRLAFHPSDDTYVQAGAYNTRVGNLGDFGGIDTSFDDGFVQIVEAGWTGRGKIAVGAWRYSKDQPDIFDVDGSGDPIPRTSQGFYLTAERKLIDGGDMGRSVSGFVRAGSSDGDTGPFKSSWATGLLIEHALSSRPDSQFSVGYDQAQLSDKFVAAAGGPPIGGTESHAEITYFDQVTPHFSIQPDLQVVFHPGGDTTAKSAWVGTIRFGATF